MAALQMILDESAARVEQVESSLQICREIGIIQKYVRFAVVAQMDRASAS